MHTLFCRFVRDVFSIVIIASSLNVRVHVFLAFYEMSILMSNGKPSTNVEHTNIHKKLLLTSVGHNSDIHKKVKKEDVNPNFSVRGCVETCFGEIPKLLPPVDNCGFIRKSLKQV